MPVIIHYSIKEENKRQKTIKIEFTKHLQMTIRLTFSVRKINCFLIQHIVHDPN